MARKKEFDTELALKEAMLLFWRNGYERTSLDNLLAVMQIGRASFYNAYGNKHSLFIIILKRYLKLANEDFILATLDKSNSPLGGIIEIIESEAKHLAADKDCKGCLMVNAEVELMMVDDMAQALITESNAMVQARFEETLHAAMKRGEILPEQDATALAEHIMNSLRGMKVLGRFSNDRKQFNRVAQVAIAALNPMSEVPIMRT